jgi:hypothetical protein
VRQATLESVSKAELLRRYTRELLTPLPKVREDPLRELVGVNDANDDLCGTVDYDRMLSLGADPPCRQGLATRVSPPTA